MTGITNRPSWADLAPITLLRVEHVVCQGRLLDVSACPEQLTGRRERLRDLGDHSWRTENGELRAEGGEQVAAMPLSPMIGVDGDLVDEVPDVRFAPIETRIGSGPENATMQLLHQT